MHVCQAAFWLNTIALEALSFAIVLEKGKCG